NLLLPSHLLEVQLALDCAQLALVQVVDQQHQELLQALQCEQLDVLLDEAQEDVEVLAGIPWLMRCYS
ncbi:hypothetical protein, partial [Klebsiella aerogenes]|uniref:hypothetical protein n=1 Tax=Klebsiella aerogenes TaxID=548 RepID=UPI001954A605